MATKVMNGLDLQSQKIINLASPSSSNDAANKAYVDALQAGLEWKIEVRAATTADGTLASAYANGSTVDGYTLVTGDRILLKNQTSGAAAHDNGIYTVNASGAPTRAVDANTSASLNNATVLVVNGTVNKNTAWTQTTADPVIGTNNIVFVQFGAGQAYTAGNGLQLSTNTFSALAQDTSLDVSSSGIRVGSGVLLSTGGLQGGSGTAVGIKLITSTSGLIVGATGLGVDYTVVTKKPFAVAIGDGSTLTYTVTHNIGSRDVITTVYDATSFNVVMADVNNATTNTVTVTFAVAPTTNAYRVVVIG